MQPHTNFCETLRKARLQAGITQQSDLAKILGVSQQAISRWERGASRPNKKQVGQLVNLLRASANELLEVYGDEALAAKLKPRSKLQPVVVTTALTQRFPIYALNEEDFERFAHHLLDDLYPGSDIKIHRVGGRGHRQGGVDLDVIFPDGTVYTFQCKRTKDFGPKDAQKAVEAHTRQSTKKFLLLTRVASPELRGALRDHSDWDVWDIDDVSLRIRKLPDDQQMCLVKVFFRGQEFALLGRTAVGPWQTVEEFFAADQSKPVNHTWELVGRAEEVDAIVDALSTPKIKAVLINGPGGRGKSRVLKAAVDKFHSTHPSVHIHILSFGELTSASLDELGKNNKILVVDDAHDRKDLELLFRYAADNDNNTQLLLAVRPYGIEHIKAQSNYSSEEICEVPLKPWTFEQAKQLASQVFAAYGGPIHTAETIAQFTVDCPLATVLGARVAAKKGADRSIEFLKNDEEFKRHILNRFQQIIAGDLGNKDDSAAIAKILKVLALIQPFNIEDEWVPRLIEEIEGLKVPDINKYIKLLYDAGVVIKLGGYCRLSPDMLSDLILEDNCIGINGKSADYAEQVFEASSERYISNILVNLGKLDWRIADGDPSGSRLLDAIWPKLKPVTTYADPYVNAVREVAYYQPERTLDFVRDLIRKREYLEELPGIIRNAAYNYKYLPRACEYLWELGKDDDRQLSSSPGHAIRILSELCAFGINKPIEYNNAACDFVLSLLDKEDSWQHAYTPLDILKSVLLTKGHTVESSGKNIAFTSFQVPLAYVSPLRVRVINAAIELLAHHDVNRAIKAAKFLQEAIRGPVGAKNFPDDLTQEMISTLEKIKQKVTERLDPLAYMEICRSVSCHARYAEGPAGKLAGEIMTMRLQWLEFRTMQALQNLQEEFIHSSNFEQRQKERLQWREELVGDLITKYPEPKDLYEFLEKQLMRVKLANPQKKSELHSWCFLLCSRAPALNEVIIDAVLQNESGLAMELADLALFNLLQHKHGDAIKIARQFLNKESPDLHSAIGRAYMRLFGDAQHANSDTLLTDLTILDELLNSRHDHVMHSAMLAIHNLGRSNFRAAFELLKSVQIGTSKRRADDVISIFNQPTMPDEVLFDQVDEKELGEFLGKIINVAELDEFWTDSPFAKLSKFHARALAAFFISRVEYAVTREDLYCNPCNYSPFESMYLRFRESSECNSLVQQVFDWMRKPTSSRLFRRLACELFIIMFGPIDNFLLPFISEWTESATPSEMELISLILKGSPNDFVFEHSKFVCWFLEQAQSCSDKVLEYALSCLYDSAITGIKSSPLGEPAPKDISMKEKTEELLKELPYLSPAHELYEWLNKDAEAAIKRSIAEGELLK